jgi:hypothetical protein
MQRTSTDHSARKPGDLLVMDLTGPLRTSSAGNRFALVVKDAVSCVTEVYLLRDKSAASVSSALTNFFRDQKAGRPHGAIPITPRKTIIQSDNDPTFLSTEVMDVLATHDVHIRTSSPDSASRNGKAETSWYRLMQDTRALLKDAHAPPSMWGHALTHAAYIHNRLPSATLGGKSPLEVLTGSAPDVGRLRVFGCKVFVWRDKRHRSGKLDSPAEQGEYLGESPHGLGHVVRVNGSVRISSHCTFDETTPAFLHTHTDDGDRLEEETDADSNEEDPASEEQPAATSDSHPPDKEPTPSAARPNIFAQLKKATDFGLVTTLDEAEDLEPTIEEALAGPHKEDYRKAMELEFDTLEAMKTFTVIKRDQVPHGEQILDMKIVAKPKINPSTGEVTKYKVRACIRGFRQRLPDHIVTTSPVVQPSSVKIILSLAASEGLDVRTLDFTSAYLNAELQVPVYVQAPPIAERFAADQILAVSRSWYGLREGSARWWETAAAAFQEIGLTQSFYDPCVFYKRNPEGKLVILGIHVDDTLLAGSKDDLDELIHAIRSKFKITEDKEALTYLGFQIRRRAEGSFEITQPEKIHRTLEVLDMLECNPVSTPKSPRSTVTAADDDDPLTEAEHVLLQRAVGQLRHISITYRLDFSVALNEISTHMAHPTRRDLRDLKHLVRYLAGTRELPLVLGSNKDTQISAFCDATWNMDQQEGRNISGAIFRFCGGTIDYFSHRQDCVASSSCHAEMIALSSTAKTVKHLRSFLEEIGYKQDPSNLYTDNEATTALAQGFGPSKKTKHVDAAHFLFQEYQRKGYVQIKQVKGTHQWADSLTKLLPREKFTMCRDFMMSSKI